MFEISDSVKWWVKTVVTALGWIIIGSALVLAFNKQQEEVLKLKDYKDGIQNHLLWSVKNECFFVRPTNNDMVYLIRVTDCDRAK